MAATAPRILTDPHHAALIASASTATKPVTLRATVVTDADQDHAHMIAADTGEKEVTGVEEADLALVVLKGAINERGHLGGMKVATIEIETTRTGAEERTTKEEAAIDQDLTARNATDLNEAEEVATETEAGHVRESNAVEAEAIEEEITRI